MKTNDNFRELLAALVACRNQLASWVDSGSTDEADHAAVRLANEAISKATKEGKE